MAVALFGAKTPQSNIVCGLWLSRHDTGKDPLAGFVSRGTPGLKLLRGHKDWASCQGLHLLPLDTQKLTHKTSQAFSSSERENRGLFFWKNSESILYIGYNSWNYSVHWYWEWPCWVFSIQESSNTACRALHSF